MSSFTIGTLSHRTGVKVETIRHYERIGLMPVPARSRGAHRRYDRDQLSRLHFIRRSRQLGFTLGAIRGLLALKDGLPNWVQARGITLRHIRDIKIRIADLRRLEGILTGIVVQCSGDDTVDCPVFEALRIHVPREASTP